MKEKLERDNLRRINLIAARSTRLIAVILIVAMLLCMYISKMDAKVLLIAFSGCAFAALIPSVLINIFKLDTKHYIRVIVVTCVSIIATVLITVLGTHAYAIVLFPIIMATLYYNQTLVLFASLLMSGGIFASNVFAFNHRDIFIGYPAKSVEESMMAYAVPQIFIVFALSVVAYFIVQRNAMMINSAIDTQSTMSDNQKGLIFALSEISESKSKFTGEHIKRVAEYMRVLGRASGFDEEYVEILATAAMAHDIGKLMISEDILEKSGKLTDEEYQIMKSHVLYGEALLEQCPGELMKTACILAKEHHEKWDGKGYLGMKGEEIAYISRLISVCDVFDALTANRSYKKGWSLEDAHDEIVRQSGKSFDPAVVRLFIQNFDKFREIHSKMPDKQKY